MSSEAIPLAEGDGLLKSITHTLLTRILVVCLLWLATSCASIEHVSLLRAEQERFSAAATRENHDVKGFLFPGQRDIAQQIERWDGRDQLRPASSVETLEAVCQDYGYVKAALDPLLADKARELQQDSLSGIATALHLFATWRLAYCRHMLHALGVRPAPGDLQTPVPALTDMAQRADALAKDARVQAELGPRDLFLLRLIPGIARFEAATIQIVRDRGYAQRPEAERRQLARGWIEQMVQADRQIEQGFSGSQQAAAHLLEYYLSARRVVLLTANNVEIRADLVGSLYGPQGQESRELLRAFYGRVDNFDEAVKKSELAAEAKTGLTQRLPVQGSSHRSPLP
jgi:hypothetical protein